ncbi:hypothetical protein [Chitinibacter sp. S2-10]|uniref:hypothetical protein n=1 Tax=Chitinibacter sp. S2-10 TaxID=3373597 RepID=UPI003977DB1F
MIFSEEFLLNLKENPLSGIVMLVTSTRDRLGNDFGEWTQEEHDTLIEAYALVCEVVDSKILNLELSLIEITGELAQDCSQISQYLNDLETQCRIESSKLKFQSFRSNFRNSFSSTFSYEFSQGDLAKIQELINQIRELVANASALEQDHQRRLLLRLEKLQSEIHKKVSDLDRFWGLIGDAGVVLGKLGNDAKPIVDRIKEVADIVWRTQSRAEELPSGTSIPLLGNKSDEN